MPQAWKNPSNPRDALIISSLKADRQFGNTRQEWYHLYGEILKRSHSAPAKARKVLFAMAEDRSREGLGPAGRRNHTIVSNLCLVTKGTDLYSFNLREDIKQDHKIGEALHIPEVQRQALNLIEDCIKDVANFENNLSTRMKWFWVASESELPQYIPAAKIFSFLGLPLFEDSDCLSRIPYTDQAVLLRLKSNVTERIATHVPSIFDAQGFDWFLPYGIHENPRCGKTVDARDLQSIRDGIREWLLPEIPFENAVESAQIIGHIVPLEDPKVDHKKLQRLLDVRINEAVVV